MDILITNVILLSITLPVVKFKECDYSNMILEKQYCVVSSLSSFVVPLGILSYSIMLVSTLINVKQELLPLLSLIFITLFGYFITIQDGIENYQPGYYLVYASITLLSMYIIKNRYE